MSPIYGCHMRTDNFHSNLYTLDPRKHLLCPLSSQSYIQLPHYPMPHVSSFQIVKYDVLVPLFYFDSLG